MPVEPSAAWYAIGVVAFAVASVAVWRWTRVVDDRLDKDRSKLHSHATALQVHELKLEEHGDAIKELKGRKE